MATFPVQIRGCTFNDLDELVDDLEVRGREGLLDNPGQSYPADHYHPMIFEDGNLALAVSEAATELMSTSLDPGVLLLCAHVGPGEHLPFYVAVLDRLDGTAAPLPDVPGAPGPRLIDDLTWIFYRPAVRADLPVFRRAVETLDRLGALEALISTLSSGDPDSRLPDVLVRYSRQTSLNPLTVGTGAYGVAKRAPDELLRVAGHFWTAEQPVKQAFVKKVELGNPGWYLQHGANLRQALGIQEPE